ncbi:translation initiation factor IF-2-like [Herpailurus yagouaroundi]|uniref:translation initiation factor IF-2-like n=1 Tax=Herpailurus yagouaroundi TaxID=1608482 RepID=UPI001AD65AE4|nr:translation initiation factor IF-2-like [Puma yagouaroundi]
MEGIPRKQRHRAAGSCPGIEGAWTILSAALLAPWDIIGVPQVSAPSWEHQRPSQMPELWTECLISVPPPSPDPNPHFNSLPCQLSPHSPFWGSFSFCLFIHWPQTHSTWTNAGYGEAELAARITAWSRGCGPQEPLSLHCLLPASSSARPLLQILSPHPPDLSAPRRCPLASESGTKTPKGGLRAGAAGLGACRVWSPVSLTKLRRPAGDGAPAKLASRSCPAPLRKAQAGSFGGSRQQPRARAAAAASRSPGATPAPPAPLRAPPPPLGQLPAGERAGTGGRSGPWRPTEEERGGPGRPPPQQSG